MAPSTSVAVFETASAVTRPHVAHAVGTLPPRRSQSPARARGVSRSPRGLPKAGVLLGRHGSSGSYPHYCHASPFALWTPPEVWILGIVPQLVSWFQVVSIAEGENYSLAAAVTPCF